MTSILDIDIPRTLDELVRDCARSGTSVEAWVFEDEPARRAAEAALAAAGVRARIRSAYKPLLHFFLEEVELTGLSAVTIRLPSHPLAVANRFRLEAYPLAGLLHGVALRFEPGADDLHYVVVTEHGARRVGIQAILFGLDRSPLARVGPAGVALRDQPADARGARRRDQVVGAARAQQVGGGEDAVEVLEVARPRQRRRFMDDGIGPRRADGRLHRLGVEKIDHHRPGAQRPQALRLFTAGRAHGADDVMPALPELGDQPLSDRAGRAADEYLHDELLSSSPAPKTKSGHRL